jgi:hypothetical protein
MGEGAYLLGGTAEAIRFINLVNPAIKRKTTAWIAILNGEKVLKFMGQKRLKDNMK